MPRQCSVLQCGKRSSENLQLFRFPTSDANRLQLWVKVTNRGKDWTPTPHSTICSDHFPRLEFDLSKRMLTDPEETGPPTKIPKRTVQLTSARVPLTLTADVNQPHGGGLRVGLVSSSKLVISTPPKRVTSIGLQTNGPDYKRKYIKVKKDIRLERLKLKATAQRLRRKEKECQTLKKFKIQILSKLSQCIVLKALVLRLLTPTKKFDTTLRSFAQTVHYYSSKAHGYVRRSLNNLIPNTRMIRRWNENFLLQPGFIGPSLSHLQKLSGTSKSTMFCSLQFDEMHIREQVISNGQSFDGYTDYAGYFLPKDPKKVANSVLVFMAVGLNSNWKVPIAFFYTRGLPVKFLHRIIPECLSRLDDSGVVCKAVVCDGLASNLSSLRRLGAKLDSEDPRPWIVHPNGRDKVHVVIDACHMIKLLRNLWKHFKHIKHHDKVFSWNYIDSLVQQQESEGLRAGTKLTSRHSHFELQKMKVNLATQVFSQSVSNALLFCEELGISKFKESGPTAKFVAAINSLFDTLNSVHPLGKGYKAPISVENRSFWQATFRNTETLLLKLKVQTDKGELLLYKTKRGTAILGLICHMRSVSNLFTDLLVGPNAKLKYLLTYKLSQDHVETFFSSIRNLLGSNTNPNVVQFKAALKKVLTSKILPSSNGNCVVQDETELSILQPINNTALLQDERSTVTSTTQPNSSEIRQEEYTTINVDCLSPYIKCVVSYIAGWVVKKLKSKIKCQTCRAALESSTTNSRDYALIIRKQNGGLIIPSENVIKVCKAAEAAYRREVISPSFRKLKIQQAVNSSVVSNNLFSNLSSHLYDSEPERNHIIELVRIITSEYLTLRMHHTAKSTTLSNKPITFRNKNTSLTHFPGV